MTGPFRFRHLGVAVPDLEQATALYTAVFGYVHEAGPFDDPIQRVTVSFLRPAVSGDPVIELVAPLETTSPVGRLLERGVGAYHVCYDTDDLDGALRHARARGCVVMGAPVHAVAFDNRRIAWLFTPTKQLVELLER